MPNKDKTGRGNFPRSVVCTCPKCKHEEPHKRGVPCSEEKCPKCQTIMRGINCL